MTDPADLLPLRSRLLCTADFLVGGGLIGIGATPFGEKRIGYVDGGHFSGPRLKGEILPGGGNWSTAGRLDADTATGTFDARVIWRTEDGVLIYMSYTGRTRVPDSVRSIWAKDANAPVSPDDYYLRIAPVFECADPRYNWLNGLLAVGVGERTPWGVRHSIYEIL